jgi:hypothetical protein
MAVPNIRIDIASVFKDKGFKQAEKSSGALETQFKRLGKTFLTVFSAAAIIRFGKESVRAFAEEEKAAKRLEQTLKGVNLGFTTPAVESYLKQLEQSTFVADDLLRPALEKLVRTTGSVTASQDLLATAIDMSAGTGFDLVSVANDLGRAFLGNARGLAKYNTSLTRADLQTKSFAEIQKVLNDQFSGQRAAYLTTYAGRLDMINTAYGNMQEAIGEGLVDAFGMLAGDSGISGATSAMEEFGIISADVIRGVGSLLGNLTSQFGGSGGLQNIIDLGAKMNNPLGTALKALQDLGAANRPLMFPTLGVGAPGYAAQQKAIEEAAAKRARQAEALRLKEIKQREKIAKLKRLSNLLDKAATKFDEKRIQIAAALQGKITNEERKRLQELLLIEETKAAIQEGDLETAEKLFAKLEKLQGQTEALAESLIDLEAGDPFAKWDEYTLRASKLVSALAAQLAKFYADANAFIVKEKEIGKPFVPGGSLTNGVTSANAAVITATNNAIVNNAATNAATAVITEIIKNGGAITDGLGNAITEATNAIIANTSPSGLAAFESGTIGATSVANRIAATDPTALVAAALTQFLSPSALSSVESGLIGASSLSSQATVIVNNYIEGSVVTENDLADTLTNLQLNQQRAGRSTLYSARAI